MTGTKFSEALACAQKSVDAKLDQILDLTTSPDAVIIEAMRYAVFNGGKRIRPFLVMESSRLFGVSETSSARVAAALELVHCYSLVHDDLPAMDDDDLRRGQPTVHRKFDEATAILAGDALLTLAFEVLSVHDTHPNPATRCELVSHLARTAGIRGMVGGQMIDLNAAEKGLDINEITRLQRLKTGGLIEFGCVSGAILGQAQGPSRDALKGYAHDLGLAFQIADDLLDAEGSEEETGKAVGKDAAMGKATFVGIMGVDRARDQARLLAEQAVEHLAIFDEKADSLRAMARYVVERRS